jgi:hypothetical protein
MLELLTYEVQVMNFAPSLLYVAARRHRIEQVAIATSYVEVVSVKTDTACQDTTNLSFSSH